jgi:hypothetical protein
MAVAVGPDGLPVLDGQGEQGPDEGLTEDNLICASAPGRPACRHYIAFLTSADGVSKGSAPLRQMRRYCTKLATATEPFEITTTNVFGCTGRDPADAACTKAVEDFEEKQREAAREMEREKGSIET